MSESESNFDLDSLLDANLDDLEDLPEFKPFAPGAHRCLLSLDKKTIAGHPAVEASFTLIETIELSNSQDVAGKDGDTCNSAFFLDNEFGRGKFKALALSLSEILGTTNQGEIVEQAKNLEVMLLSSVKKDKNDASKVYLNIISIEVI